MTPADQAAATARRMPWMAGASVLALSTLGLSVWTPWNDSAPAAKVQSIEKRSPVVTPPRPASSPMSTASATSPAVSAAGS